MLQLTGTTLDVTVEIVSPPNGTPFESTTIVVLSGEGANTEVAKVRTGKDFRSVDLPKKGEVVTLDVVVSTWSGKNGAGYRLTALSRAATVAGARATAAV